MKLRSLKLEGHPSDDHLVSRHPVLPTGPEVQGLVLHAVEALGGRAHRRAITRRAVELGAFTREQLAVPPPATNQGGFPNRIEYMVSIALSALKKKGKLTNVGGGEWVVTSSPGHQAAG